MNSYPYASANLNVQYWKSLILDVIHQNRIIQFSNKLTGVIDILKRIITLPLDQTLQKSVYEYFLVQIFPYFNSILLQMNLIEDNEVDKFNQITQLLTNVYIKLINNLKDQQLQQKGFKLLANISKSSNYKNQNIFNFCWDYSINKTTSSSISKILIDIFTSQYKNNNTLTTYIKRNIKTILQNISSHKLNLSIKILNCVFSKFNIIQDQDIFKQLQQIDIIIYNVMVKITNQKKYFLISRRYLRLLKLTVNNNFPIYLRLEVFLNIIEIVRKQYQNQNKRYLKKWCLNMLKLQNVFLERDKIKLEQLLTNFELNKGIEEMIEYDFELFKLIFIIKNKQKGKLKVKDHQYKTKVLQINCNFPSLEFYDTLITIFLHSKKRVSSLVFKFYSIIYLMQKLTFNQRQKYLTQTLQKLFHFYDQNNTVAINRCLQLIQLIIDQSEQEGEVRIQSLNKLSHNQTIIFEVNKKYDVHISCNDTFINLRKNIAMKYETVWKSINVFKQKYKNNMCNNKLIKHLLKDKLIKHLFKNKQIQVKFTSSPNNHKIRENGIFCKEAISAFKIIFNNYSINGLMSKQKYQQYIDVIDKYFEHSSLKFYLKYDDDRDGFISLNDLLRYYDEKQQKIIWEHLTKMNIRYDLKNSKDPDIDLLQHSNLLRVILSKNKKFIEILQNLLKNHETSVSSWKVLSQLPIIQSMKQYVLQHYKQIKYNLKNPYETLIILHISWHLLYSQNLTEKQYRWKQKFLENNQYIKLFDFLISIMQDKEKCNQKLMCQVKMKIVNQILDIIYEYVCIFSKLQSNINRTGQPIRDYCNYMIEYISNLKKSSQLISFHKKLPKQSQNYFRQNAIDFLINWIKKLLVHKTQKRKQAATKCLKILSVLLSFQHTCLPLITNTFELFFSYENIIALQNQILVTLDQLFYLVKSPQKIIIKEYLIQFLHPKYQNTLTKVLDLPFFKTYQSLLLNILKQTSSNKLNQYTLQFLFVSIVKLKNPKFIQICLNVLQKSQLKQIKVELIQNMCQYYLLSNHQTNIQNFQKAVNLIYKMIKTPSLNQITSLIVIKTMQKYISLYQKRKDNHYSYDHIRFYEQFIKLKFNQNVYQKIIKVSLRLISSLWKLYPSIVLKILKRIRMYYTINQKWQKQFLQTKQIILLFQGQLSESVQKLLLSELNRIINKLVTKNNLPLLNSNQLDTLVTSFLDNVLDKLQHIDNRTIFQFWAKFMFLNQVHLQFVLKESNLIKFVTFFSKNKLFKTYLVQNDKKIVKTTSSKQINYYYCDLLRSLARILVKKLNSQKTKTIDFLKIVLNIDFLCQVLVIGKQYKQDITNLFKQLNMLCINNFRISERIALVYLRAIKTKNNIILQQLNQYLMIDDSFMKHRVKWIFGHCQINIQTNDKTLDFYSLNNNDIVNLYSYDSTLIFDNTKSLLECIIRSKIYEVFIYEILKLLFTLCKNNKFFLQEILSLPSPNYVNKNFNHFLFSRFIQNKFSDSTTNFSPSKQIKILGKQMLELYKDSTLLNYVSQDESSNTNIKLILFPIKFKYIQTSSQSFGQIIVHNHSSELLLSSISKENEKQIKKYEGIFVENKTSTIYRFRWDYGVGYLEPGSSKFVECNKIIQIWAFGSKNQLWNDDSLLNQQ